MRRILKKGRNCFTVKGAGRSGLVVDGREYYRLFYEAARKAKSHILVAGWQFDSTVELLRGPDARGAEGDVRFLAFLNGLCRENPQLRVHILAWDFSLIFALEREWMQEWVFNWATSERLFFHFDSRHALGASVHEKYAVIDTRVAFLGGMDICASRWDDRDHLAENPYRADRDGAAYLPYHDIQSYHTGPLVKKLASLFAERWKDCTGNALELPSAPPGDYLPPDGCGIPVSAHRIGLSRTRAQSFSALSVSVREIRSLYLDAINGARKIIYIENQYFSSYAVYGALLKRMEAPGRPKLQIIIVLPERPQGFLETISLGLTQARLIRSLRETAERTGHRFGAYYPAARSNDGGDIPVYIHSKLMIVDDRFLTIGSANATNRSMGLDTELNVSWEVDYRRRLKSVRSLKRVRAELLSEHMGVRYEKKSRLHQSRGIVEYLDAVSASRLYRLRRHAYGGGDGEWLMPILDAYLLDPEKTVIEENLFEMITPDISSIFKEGARFIKNWLDERKKGRLRKRHG